MLKIDRSSRGRPTALPAAATPKSARRQRYLLWRSRIERFLAAMLLVPCSVLIGVCVLLVRCTSRGPGIYRQVRVGRGHRPFQMFKIRTMRADAEAATGPVWSTGHDPRVTRVGRVLRWTHLDELPQLLNILQGQMSIVGPRPERPEFVERLRARLPHYDARFSILPGVTGLAQVSRPSDRDLDDVRKKLVLEIVYLRHVCLWLDFRILARTLLHLLGYRPRATRHQRERALRRAAHGEVLEECTAEMAVHPSCEPTACEDSIGAVLAARRTQRTHLSFR